MDTNRFSIDARMVSVVLLAIIVVMLVLWKPWQSEASETITVTGTSVVTEKPDLFTFSPNYAKTADTQEKAIEEVSAIGNGVVAKLKELGVADKDLKTSVNNYENYEIAPVPVPTKTATGYRANYSVTAKVRDEALVQKIVDYLATTPVEYAVTPQAEFSEALKSRLESEARTAALKDAKAKAEETAETLGLRLGKVASVQESNPFGGPILYSRDTAVSSPGAAVAPDYQPGENDYTFQVSVEYQIR